MKVIPWEVRKQSPITNSRFIRELRKRLSLSAFQKRVLIGTLLGDGCLTPNAYGKNYRLQIVHGKKQREYLFWKYKIFKEWVLSKPKFILRTQAWKFRTVSHPEFTTWQRKFYKGKRKILPKDIEKFLRDPLILAVWFMDDGGKMRDKNREYGNLLNVQKFPLEDVVRLQEILLKNLNLPTTRQWNNRGYRIYLGRKYCRRFNSLIAKYILPTFKYKLILTP